MKNNKTSNGYNVVKSSFMYGILIIIMIGAFYFYSASRYTIHNISYDEFIENISNDKIKEINTEKNIIFKKKKKWKITTSELM